MAGLAARTFARMSMDVGHIVSRRMAELGMSQTALARRTGIPRRTIINWLKQPSWDSLAIELVSEVLEMNIFQRLADELNERGLKTNARTVSEPQAEYGRKMIKLTVEMEDDPENRERILGLTQALPGSYSKSTRTSKKK